MKKIIFTLFSFLFTAHIIFSAQQNSEQSAQQERQSTVNQASRSQARQKKLQNV
jgi:hypothetical protein